MNPFAGAGRPLALLVLALTLAACAAHDSDDGAASVVAAASASCQPEPTDARQRNADGQLRQCWPGEASCACDARDDCYAQPGYVSCAGRATAAGMAVAPTSGVAGRAVTITASSAGSTAPLYKFLVWSPATAAWTAPCGEYTEATTCQFTPDAPGHWRTAVWARSAAGDTRVLFEAATDSRWYRVASAQPVTAVEATVAPAAGVAGRAVTITASSTGSSSPRYRFLVWSPATAAWALPCGDYGAAATCQFTPDVPGRWRVHVWARDAATADRLYETTSEARGLPVAPAPTVAQAVAPARGTAYQPLTITATSTGVREPRYRFWAVTPQGSWTRPCGDWGTAASCTFTPGVAGTWQTAVSVRAADSTAATYDATTGARAYAVADAAPPPPTPPPPAPGGALPAFPGAQGFGAFASGGRGGRVVYVTNLNTSGPGSLQDALEQPGPRYVLFRVSGVIDGPVHLRRGDVTIAGQTSPGGVTVRGFDTTEEPYCGFSCGPLPDAPTNWILRHIRSRPGNVWFPDGLRLRHTRHAIVDHVSIGNATDEAIEISYANHVTVQNTLLAETVGGHSRYGGVLVNYSDPARGFALDRIALHHNTWNRLEGRLPELSRESPGAAGTTMQIEISSNLLWDPDYFVDVNNTVVSGGGDGASIFYALNMVGNYAFARAGHRYGLVHFTGGARAGTSTYLADNQMNLYPSRRDYELMYGNNDYPSAGPQPAPSFARSTRHDFPAIGYTSATSLRAYMVANVGAFPRDPMDRRLMGPVAHGVIDPTARNVNPAGDALATDFAAGSPPPPPVDTDVDGMPDAWELEHGLDPRVQDHNGGELSVRMTGVAGYTNLECYLNELAERRVAAAQP